MPDIPSTEPLYRIDECPDLFVDGYVGDDQANLVFLSLWARDTAVQEFLARLTLRNDEQGLKQFHLLVGGGSLPVHVANVELLDKRMTRAFRQTLFGSLVNLWLYDRRCLTPDKANATAMALIPNDAKSPGTAPPHERLWRLVCDTCPLPLLPHWRDRVLSLLQSNAMLVRYTTTVGPLQGYRLQMDIPALTETLGDLIRSGTLRAEADSDTAPAVPVCAAT